MVPYREMNEEVTRGEKGEPAMGTPEIFTSRVYTAATVAMKRTSEVLSPVSSRCVATSTTVPEEDVFYMPVACQQCSNPPCVRVCPVEATWQEPDGIVVVDYDWCLGCRCCLAACACRA